MRKSKTLHSDPYTGSSRLHHTNANDFVKEVSSIPRIWEAALATSMAYEALEDPAPISGTLAIYLRSRQNMTGVVSQRAHIIEMVIGKAVTETVPT